MIAPQPEEVVRVAEASLPLRQADFRIAVFDVRGTEVVAVTLGDHVPDPVLVRLHSSCLTGDALGSLRCDCGEQLQASLAMIARAGSGILLYLDQEGRGIGLRNKIRAYALQDQGLDTVEANRALGLPVDAREYRSAATLLLNMGVTRVRLITNNPAKVRALRSYGITVSERVPIQMTPNQRNRRYLKTKRQRMGHLLDLGSSSC